MEHFTLSSGKLCVSIIPMINSVQNDSGRTMFLDCCLSSVSSYLIFNFTITFKKDCQSMQTVRTFVDIMRQIASLVAGGVKIDNFVALFLLHDDEWAAESRTQ